MNPERCITDDDLAAWTEGAASSDQVAAMTAHVGGCRTCRVVLSELTRTSGSRPVAPTLGRYQLQEKVGEGGMGTVFAAWDPTLGRTVAVKILHEVRDGASRRFLLERQILAGLEHPNIGRLLDAGETAEGRPYFVMELIDGQPIDQYCDAHRLSTRHRLKLMLPVFAAVSHAHQHLVVHRDLKPSNILVTGAGVPKLLDFGIARLLEATAGLTVTGLAPMTPSYASPEQVRSEPIATTSDVYSLGVVLHELLVGVSPHAVPRGDLDALLRAVCGAEPGPASAALARAPDEAIAHRAPSRERLRRELEGDVDAIVSMALRSEPKDRYPSAQALADDVRAALDGLPTAARKGNAAYRAVKFVRRHRSSVAALVAAFVALSAGLVTTAWQARRAQRERDLAERRFEQVRAIAHSVLFDYHDGIADLPGATPVRERLVKDALAYLDSLATEARDDVGLRGELAQGYLKIGDVQGDPFASSLGDVTSAKANYLKARTIAEAMPGDRGARQVVSRSHEKVGAILEVSGDLRGALAEYELARGLDEALLNEAPEVDQRAFVGRDELSMGQVLMQLGELDRAAELHERSLATRQAVAKERPDVVSRRGVAAVRMSYARLLKDQGHVPEATAQAEQAEALCAALVAEFPDSTNTRRCLTTTWQLLGDLVAHADPVRAIDYARRHVAVARKDLTLDPDNAVAMRDAEASLASLADSLETAEQLPEATAVIGEALALNEKMIARDPANQQNRVDRGHLLIVAGSLDRDRHEYAGAAHFFQTLKELGEALVAADPENIAANETLYDGWNGLASVAGEQHHLDQALADNARALEVVNRLLAKEPTQGRLRNRRALTMASKGVYRVEQASQAHGPARRPAWELARADTAAAFDALDALKKEDALFASAEKVREEAKEALARCDAELAGK